MNEVWVDIPEWVGYYQASNLGRIKSIARKIKKKDGKTENRKEKIMSLSIKDHGYLQIILRNKNKIKTMRVHRIIMSAFNGISELQVDHINGIKVDNRIENLEYVTDRENKKRYHIQHPKTSKHVGVSFVGNNKYLASITINRKQLSLGRYNCETAAMIAYQKKLQLTENILRH